MSEYPEPEGEVASVSPAVLRRALDAGEPVTLLDVRNRSAVEQWHIDGESLERHEIPYTRFLEAELADSVADLAADLEGPVTVVCGRGEASAYVAEQLESVGIEARNLAGGMDAWGRLYDATEIPAEAVGDAGATVVQYHRPSSGCLSYLVVSGDEAVVVDPLLAFVDRYREDAADRGAALVTAVDTHVHADHVSGVRRLADREGVEGLLPRRAVERGVEWDVTPLDEDASIPVGDAALEVVPLPGHTTGMTGYAVGNVLLAGDSMFLDGVARPDLEADDDGAPTAARELHRTLTERLGAFDDGTVVAPGHVDADAERAPDGTYTATLGALRERLSAFETDREAFVERIGTDLPPRPANFARIVDINLGRKQTDEDEAFELEQGPNNCAAVGTSAN